MTYFAPTRVSLPPPITMLTFYDRAQKIKAASEGETRHSKEHDRAEQDDPTSADITYHWGKAIGGDDKTTEYLWHWMEPRKVGHLTESWRIGENTAQLLRATSTEYRSIVSAEALKDIEPGLEGYRPKSHLRTIEYDDPLVYGADKNGILLHTATYVSAIPEAVSQWPVEEGTKYSKQAKKDQGAKAVKDVAVAIGGCHIMFTNLIDEALTFLSTDRAEIYGDRYKETVPLLTLFYYTDLIHQFSLVAEACMADEKIRSIYQLKPNVHFKD